MLPLSFQEYQKTLKIEQKTRFPTQYFLEDNESITLLFKTKELWEHYTIVSKSDIIGFSEIADIPPDEAIDQFKINYCSNCIELSKDEEFGIDILSKIKKQEEINPGEDVIDESVEYKDFYRTVVDKWEEKTLKALDEIPIEKIYSPDTTKAFGEFLRRLMNSINSVVFLRAIKRYVKIGMVAGLDSAEEEIGVQVGFTDAFEDTSKILQQQQIEGYTINGQKWHGIKGATKELQFKIIKQVQEDVSNKVPRQKMRENIQEIFEGSTTAQAERIARTETTRFINQGKLTAYKESGVKGGKVWSTVIDSRTSDICKNLHNKYFNKPIPLDDVFIDDVTGKSFDTPPAHPNCRSVIAFRVS